MKIVRIISRLNIGGPAIHTILLSSSLNKDGYTDILVCGQPSQFEGDMHELAKSNNIKPVMVPTLQRDISICRDIKAFFKLYSIIRKERPDIVHTHTAKAGTLGRLAAVLAGVPVRVHTFHGHVFDGYFNPSRAKVFLLIERFLALFTDRVVTVSSSVRNEIVNKLKIADESKSIVIPLGLDLDKYLRCTAGFGSLRKRFGLGSDAILVGIVGRLVPVKNHKMFLDAALKVIETMPNRDIKFFIVGDGELNEGLKQYASALGLGGKVIFTGWVDDLAGVYSDLDIVALTSLNEGTPVSLIEAMASGKAVIATDVGGVRDIINDGACGVLARSTDVDDFCSKLKGLIRDKEARIRLGANARKTVASRYARERLVKDVKSLYEGLYDSKVGKKR
jgi:glycosyltransferase involved in cell wall biosynthesis